MRGPRSIRELLKAIEAEGGTVELTKGSHYRARHPKSDRCVHFPSTPSRGRRSLLNTIADLRRSGFILRGKP